MKRKALTATRKDQIEVLPDGTVTTGNETLIDFRASIQPFDKKQLESYPFLRDYKQLYTLFSDTELLVSKAGISECDTVQIYGTNFDVLTCEFWQNAIRPHYKIIVGR
jgi:hypothetical protein